MKLKIKSIIVISVLLLSLFTITINFILSTKNQSQELNKLTNVYTNHRGNQNFSWGPIEVISEPIFGQDNNLGKCKGGRLAVEGDKIYVVWSDNSSLYGAGGDYDVFFRCFDGNIWSEIQVISEPLPGKDINIGGSYDPNIAVEDGKIFVVWYDWDNTNGAGEFDSDIFYRCNLTGSNWEEIQVISEPVVGKDNNIEMSECPEIAVENGNIYVVWHDWNNTNGANVDADIFYRCNLTGSNWEETQIISEPILGSNINDQQSYVPSIAVENSKIYMVWEDRTNISEAGDDFDIFYICNISGNSWEDFQIISDPILNNNINWSSSPAIAVENNKIYVVWDDNDNTNGAGDTDKDIFYRTNLTGSNWEDLQVLSEPIPGKNININHSYHPRIKVKNNKLHLVWYDRNNTNNAGNDIEIFYRCNLTGTNWEEAQVISEPIFGENINIDKSWMPDIAVEQDNIYVIWRDKNNTNGAGTDEDIFIRTTTSVPMSLRNPSVKPVSGYTDTDFNFTITYFHMDNKAPVEIKVNISGINYSMIETNSIDKTYYDGKGYFFNIANLNISIHSFNFWAYDGANSTNTNIFNKPLVYNTIPKITVQNNLTAIEDIYYEVSYEYEDIDVLNIAQHGIWNFSTNASWLNFNPTTAILFGTPTNDDVGQYWVNISINDTIDIDFSNFTLTVVDINDRPIINMTNKEITFEDIEYFVNYNATDIDSLIENQIWHLETNGSSWLEIDWNTGILNGTPTNDEVGIYWVNVSVNDSDGGLDFTNFTLTVLNINDPPFITTDDVFLANVSELYEVDYNASDIDSVISQQKWSLDTNASGWLSIDTTTGLLSGIPEIIDVGWYNVNVSVDDGDGGFDWHKFILTVKIKNKPPVITTEDELIAMVDIYYSVDYNATDDRTPENLLEWELETNATWLNIDSSTGILSGSPTKFDIGWYWVTISVRDDEGDITNQNFILTVQPQPPPPPPNIVPILEEAKMNPNRGSIETNFTFSVHYYDANNDAPEYVQLIIDANIYNMKLIEGEDAFNGTYIFKIKLTEGPHTFYFVAFDGNDTVRTEEFTTPYIGLAEEEPQEKFSWEWVIWPIIILIIIMILLMIKIRKRKERPELIEEQLPSEIETTPQFEESPYFMTQPDYPSDYDEREIEE